MHVNKSAFMALHWNGCTLLQQDYQRSFFPATGLVEKMLRCPFFKGAGPNTRPPARPPAAGRPTMYRNFHMNTFSAYCNCSFAQSHITCPAPDIKIGCFDVYLFNWLSATPLVSCYSPCCPYLVCLEIGPGFEISDSVPGTAPCVFSWCA